MASRRKGRILAFQALYSWDTGYSQTGNTSISEELLNFSWIANNTQLNEEMTAFSRLLITGTVQNIATVDDMIGKHLENWELKRLNRVDLAVLRMSVYTLMFRSEIHPSIVIDEAIDISREFGTVDSYRFVNGVLDSVRKTLYSVHEPDNPGPTVSK
jgi:N utilization substance protein B